MSYTNESYHTWIFCAIFLNSTMTASNVVRVVRVMSHTNESCHVRAVHIAWVLSYMNESRHTWMCAQMFWTPPWLPQMWRVVRFMSHVNEPWHVSVVHEVWVMSYVNTSRHRWMTAHSHESCHIWISHVTYEWLCQCFESRDKWKSHVTYGCPRQCFERYYDCLKCGARGMYHESCHTWMSHGSYQNMSESCHIWMTAQICWTLLWGGYD